MAENCALCKQEPYVSQHIPCPWHEPEQIALRARFWAQYDTRKAVDPNSMTEDTNENPPLGRRYR